MPEGIKIILNQGDNEVAQKVELTIFFDYL